MGLSKGTSVSTSIEVEKRVELVAEMYIRGIPRAKGFRFVNNPEGEHNWGIDIRQYDNYIKRAKKLIKDQSKGNADEFKNLAFARYNDLYQKNYAEGDLRECRNVQDSLNKLLGINEPDKANINLTGSITPDKWLKDNSSPFIK